MRTTCSSKTTTFTAFTTPVSPTRDRMTVRFPRTASSAGKTSSTPTAWRHLNTATA
ncbi:MAG: hypothetical protein IJ449_06115 [Clostridia bacterium]|nr:hypothetical protein [Clostridia bacterium]